MTNASARSSRSVHRATNVSCCQCSSVPASDGVFVKRIDSRPEASAISMSPYQASVYVPAYLASGSDGFDEASRAWVDFSSVSANRARFRARTAANCATQSTGGALR